jgi:hypothetical protein
MEVSMKKILSFQILIAIFVSLFFVSSASALGLGFYGSFGSGSGEWEVDPDEDSDYTVDTDNEHRSFGFVLDTAVAKDKVFNYRLQVGIDKWKEKDFDGGEFEIDGFVVDNDFGFGVVRRENFRLWLGPELRIEYGEGILNDNTDAEVALIGIGVGPVIGVNFNFGKTFTLGLKSGYLFEGYGGTGRDLLDSESYTIRSRQLYFNAAIIFRINDTFK